MTLVEGPQLPPEPQSGPAEPRLAMVRPLLNVLTAIGVLVTGWSVVGQLRMNWTNTCGPGDSFVAEMPWRVMFIVAAIAAVLAMAWASWVVPDRRHRAVTVVYYAGLAVAWISFAVLVALASEVSGGLCEPL